MKRGFLFGMILISTILGSVWGETLTILYTNDIHTRLGRLPGLAARIEEVRASAPGPVLLFDSGDTWQDYRVPIYAVWGAARTLEWMNEVGYDAMALGNHDLYYGAARLAALARKARFPILCANLKAAPGFDPPFAPYTFVDAGRLRVLVIGLITDEYLPYLDYPWLTYVDPAAALAGVLKREGGKADLVVVLGHLPVKDAVRIVKKTPGIDVFLTGHSHELTRTPVRVGKTIVLQAGAFGRYLGALTLTVDPATGAVEVEENTFYKVKETPVDQDRGYIRLGLLGTALLGLLFLLL